jgi:hypothetical protein
MSTIKATKTVTTETKPVTPKENSVTRKSKPVTTKAPVIKSAKTTNPMIIKEKPITQSPIKHTDVNVPIKHIVKKAPTKQTIAIVPTKQIDEKVPIEMPVVKKPIKKINQKQAIVEKHVLVPIKKANAKSAKAKISRIKATSKEIVVEDDIDDIDEEWKVIPGFANYESSNLGNIRNKNNKRPLKGSKKDGYVKYNMIDDNGKQMGKFGHRIIAIVWIKNSENKPTVDHINNKRDDNRVKNLRWATFKEQSHNKDYININNNNSRGIWRCDLNTGTKIKFYKTNKEAAFDVNGTVNGYSNISFCATGKTKSAFGFGWIYDNDDNKDLENEEWKLYLTVKSNNYYISDHGRVKNNNRILKTAIRQGYDIIIINKKSLLVHRLVATLFVENLDPTKYNIVNHKNADKKNNNATNLEWLDIKGNNDHAVQNNLNKTHKKVVNYDDNENIIKIYTNCSAAARDLKINRSSINACCKGFLKTCGNSKLKFKFLANDDLENMKIKQPSNALNKSKTKKKKLEKRAVEVYKDGKLIEICRTKSEVTRKYKVNYITVTHHCLNKTQYPNIKYIFKYAD